MEGAIKTRKPKQRPKHLLSTFIAYFFIMLLVFHTRDFLTAIVKDQYSYELKYQSVETTNGNTDIKYCAIIYETRGLVFSAILTAMIILVLMIAANSRNYTPFTRKNAKRIKAIGYLQFSLAIVPGLIECIMKSLKFEYIYLHPRKYSIRASVYRKKTISSRKGADMAIIIRLDRIMADRKMSLNTLAERVGMTNVNLSNLKTGKMKGIKFETMNAICRALDCQPADLFEYTPDGDE